MTTDGPTDHANLDAALDDGLDAELLAMLAEARPSTPLPDGLPLNDERPTLVCFDLDGCLVDSDEAIAYCLNLALAEHDVPTLTLDDIRHRIGPPLHGMVATILDELLEDPSLLEPIVAAYRTHYRVESTRRTTPIKGVVALVRRLSGVHTIGVVTTKPHRFAVPIVDAVGLRRDVDFVVGPDLAHTDEPKAETLERAIELHGEGLPVVMIGDRSFDVEAGKANGAITIGVLWGYGTREELETAGADVICEDAYDLAEALVTGRFQPPVADE